MSTLITITSNTPDFIREVKKQNLATQNRVRRVVKETAFDLVSDAAQTAPIQYGPLRRSIQILARRVDGFGYAVGSHLNYSEYLEQPDKPYIRPKAGRKGGQYPFLRPAAKKLEPQFVRKLRKALG